VRAKRPLLNAGDKFRGHSLLAEKSNRRDGALQALDFFEVENAGDVDGMANLSAGTRVGRLPGRREIFHTRMHRSESADVKLDVDLQQFAVRLEKQWEGQSGHLQ
jgi:hypothetical protein